MYSLIAREKFGYANFWGSPIWWARKKLTKSRLEKQQLSLLHILMVRYRGVMSQILKRAKVREEDIDRALCEVWIQVQTEWPATDDYRTFSGALWNECMKVAEVPVPALKPKLMLRQFVDEMQPSDERGVLISRAYNSNSSSPPVEREILFKLSAAYALLHAQVLNHEDDLIILTDEAITPDMIRGFTPPYVQYKKWLFDS